MKSIEIITKVNNGNFKRNRNEILKAIKQFEGKTIMLKLSILSKKRSLEQNSYYWGVIIPITKNAISESWGEVWNTEKTHEFLKSKFLFYEKVNQETSEIIKVPKSTTENTTTEQEVYYFEIREFLKEWFNVDCPLPNENLTLV
jgi:hypothetical protein